MPCSAGPGRAETAIGAGRYTCINKTFYGRAHGCRRWAMVARMDARQGPFDEFAIATQLLTRLPVGAGVPAEGAIAASGWAFPLVRAGIGALAALAFLAAQLAGCGNAVAALLAVAAGLALTGALHEDGLAD